MLLVMMIEPSIILQADATVIAGIFIFLTVLKWSKTVEFEYNHEQDIADKKTQVEVSCNHNITVCWLSMFYSNLSSCLIHTNLRWICGYCYHSSALV
jgi:hypothetical protein